MVVRADVQTRAIGVATASIHMLIAGNARDTKIADTESSAKAMIRY